MLSLLIIIALSKFTAITSGWLFWLWIFWIIKALIFIVNAIEE